MTERRALDLNGVLDAYLGEGPAQAPDRVLFGALDEVASTPQRRRPLFAWRFPMPAPVRLALAGALLVVALVAVAIFVGSNPPNVPAPSTSPSPVGSTESSASPVPTATAAATPLPTPVISAISLSSSALNRVDSAITAAQRPTELTVEDQSQLFRLSDTVRAGLDLNDLAAAVADFPALSTRATELAAKLTPEHSARLLGAVTALGRILESTALPSGDLAAGTYFSTRFSPVVVVTMPAGWRRVIEDAEVIDFQKGNVSFAFDRMGVAVTPDDVAKAVGRPNAADLATAPVAVTLGRFAGFMAEVRAEDGGAATLWYTESLQAHDSEDGDGIWVWVVQLDDRALTIHLNGPQAEVDAVIEEVQAIVATLETD